MSENLKTGTTTLGLVCKDCVILAADKRATAGHLIANKAVDKVVPIGTHMAITTAGSVSEIQLLTKIIRAELRLKDIRTNRGSTIKEAANLLSNMVYSSIRSYFPAVAHFLLGGYDGEVKLYDIFPDGSTSEITDFVATGSGSLFAYGVLENNYEQNMSKEKGIQLAKNAINASMQRDSASGNGIDIFVISKDGVEKAFSKMLNTKLE